MQSLLNAFDRYTMQASSEADRDAWISCIQAAIVKIKAENEASRQRAGVREWTKTVHDSSVFQGCSALLIIATFVCNVVTAQLYTSGDTATLETLDTFDTICTILFMVPPPLPPSSHRSRRFHRPVTPQAQISDCHAHDDDDTRRV